MSNIKNNNRHFSTQHLECNLKRLSVRGGAVTFIAQGAKFFLNIISMMILARILTPADFGLIAMVTAITGFILVFKDMGLSMATVQRSEINHEQISTLFWINVAISVLLMLITLALSPVVGWFYNDQRLVSVTAMLSMSFFFGGLTIQHQALLRRQMRLLSLATIDVLASASGVFVAVISAIAGLGYWSLVWMQIATAAINAMGVWTFCRWIPGIPLRKSGVYSMLKFGGHLTGFSLVNYFARSFDNILIGRYCGAQSLGLYSRAYSLLMFPIGQITAPMTSVAVPALSRLQSEPERYRRYYLKSIKLIAYISMPVVAVMAVLSSEIVEIVLGIEWIDAGPIFKILAVAAILQPVSSTVGWIYVSSGNTKRMFLWIVFVTPVLLLFFIAGLAWGAAGVATGYSICNYIILWPQLSFALKYTPISAKDVLFTIHHPFVLSGLTASVMMIVRAHALGAPLVLNIFYSLIVGAIAFITLACGVKSFRKDIAEIIEIRRILFIKTKSSS
ncbi:MAG: lipopolysaccharide biosynthesis protein [Bacteroidia bacterium]|nr:lipopolysaccharide biosynthesis protein [Bacteroidia bacterium]